MVQQFYEIVNNLTAYVNLIKTNETSNLERSLNLTVETRISHIIQLFVVIYCYNLPTRWYVRVRRIHITFTFSYIIYYIWSSVRLEASELKSAQRSNIHKSQRQVKKSSHDERRGQQTAESRVKESERREGTLQIQRMLFSGLFSIPSFLNSS
jgi:hypothetical protein